MFAHAEPGERLVPVDDPLSPHVLVSPTLIPKSELGNQGRTFESTREGEG